MKIKQGWKHPKREAYHIKQTKQQLTKIINNAFNFGYFYPKITCIQDNAYGHTYFLWLDYRDDSLHYGELNDYII